MAEALIEVVQLLVAILIEEKKLTTDDKQIITTEVSNHIYGNIKTKFGEKFLSAVECFEIEKDFEELSDSWRQIIQLKREAEPDPTALTRDDSHLTAHQIPLLLKDVISQQRVSKLRAFSEAVLHQTLNTQEQVSRLKAAVNRLAPSVAPHLVLNSGTLLLERPSIRAEPRTTLVPSQAPSQARSTQPAPPVPVLTPVPSVAGNTAQICASLAWQQHHTVYVLDSPNLPGNSKVIGFDMDSTLIATKSGRSK
jgi:hypothetical protein